MAYVDFNTKLLFKGIINRPVDIHAREFRLEQKDKIAKFIDELIPAFKANSIKERVFKLAASFALTGKTKANIKKYQKLDDQIRETAMAVAKKVGRKKFGYMRSPNITLCGRLLILSKMILDCKSRHAPYTIALIKRAEVSDAHEG